MEFGSRGVVFVVVVVVGVVLLLLPTCRKFRQKSITVHEEEENRGPAVEKDAERARSAECIAIQGEKVCLEAEPARVHLFTFSSLFTFTVGYIALVAFLSGGSPLPPQSLTQVFSPNEGAK